MRNVPIQITQGDYGFQQPFQLLNADGSLFDLTGCAVSINIQFQQTSQAKVTNGSMIATLATSGFCYYIPPSGTFDEWGIYLAQIVVTPNAGGKITFPNIQIEALQNIPSV